MIGKWLAYEDRSPGQYQSIQANDMILLRSYFDASTPKKLQEEIWFIITYYFGLRGRETLPQLTKDAISFETDSDNKEYACMNRNVLSKNVKASLNKREHSDDKDYRIYKQDNSLTCPVSRLKLYFSKIPESNKSLFPLSEKNWFRSSMWYCKSRGLGRNTLETMMKTISKDAGLSTSYTNHCVRVTVVTELKEQGFSNEDITNVTGHKSASSVSRYYRQRNDSEKRKLSESLHSGFCEKFSVSQTVNGDQQTISVAKGTNAEIICRYEGTFNNCTFITNS